MNIAAKRIKTNSRVFMEVSKEASVQSVSVGTIRDARENCEADENIVDRSVPDRKFGSRSDPSTLEPTLALLAQAWNMSGPIAQRIRCH